MIATRFDGRGRKADGSSVEEARGRHHDDRDATPTERRAGTAKEFESRPRDLELDVPEFLPGKS